MPDRGFLYKILCVQTYPGCELEVARQYSDRLTEASLSHSILKGLGSFDLIIVYAVCSLKPALGKAGPISDVAKSNVFYCYSIANPSQFDLVGGLNSASFSSISFLKLRKEGSRELGQVLESIRCDPSCRMTCLGSLGWSECVTFISGNSIETVLERQLQVQQGKLGADSLPVHKSFSLLGLNIYPAAGCSHEDWDIKRVGVHSSLEPGEAGLHRRLEVTVRVSCLPSAEKDICSYWGSASEQLGVPTTILHLFGRYDLAVRFHQPPDWDAALKKILTFRKEFGAVLLGTNTSISLLT